jgi:hypothetical protein
MFSKGHYLSSMYKSLEDPSIMCSDSTIPGIQSSYRKNHLLSHSESGLSMLPLLPNIRNKILTARIKDPYTFNKAVCDNDSVIVNKLYTENYRNYVKKEINKTKSNKYVGLAPEDQFEVGITINLQGATNESIIDQENQNQYTSKFREEIFGEFHPTIDQNIFTKSLKREIEGCDTSDLLKIYINAVKNKKENELIDYIMSGSSHNAPGGGPKLKKPFTGVADLIYKRSVLLFEKATVQQDLARQGTKDISKISDELMHKLHKLLTVKDQRAKKRRRREQTKASIREAQGTTITEDNIEPEVEMTHHGTHGTTVSWQKNKNLPAIEKSVWFDIEKVRESLLTKDQIHQKRKAVVEQESTRST